MRGADEFGRFCFRKNVLKNDDRQKIEVIYNPKTNQRFIKRSVNDDIRYIYKMLQKINNNHIPKIYDVELTDKTRCD